VIPRGHVHYATCVTTNRNQIFNNTIETGSGNNLEYSTAGTRLGRRLIDSTKGRKRNWEAREL
jgi:hypothetical protein